MAFAKSGKINEQKLSLTISLYKLIRMQNYAKFRVKDLFEYANVPSF